MSRRGVVTGIVVLAGALLGLWPGDAPDFVLGARDALWNAFLGGDRVTAVEGRGKKGKEPEWLARRRAWIDARSERHRARWAGSLPRLVEALRQEAKLESLYFASLEAASRGKRGSPAASPQALRDAALDAFEHNRGDLARRLLDVPSLRGDLLALALRAQALGSKGAADSGLSLLGWPPDRRRSTVSDFDLSRRLSGQGNASIERSALLLVAGSLADSADEPRATRAAYWSLLASDPSPAARRIGRMRLARALLRDGTPRLALAMLTPEEESGADAALLAASARAASGDTAAAIAGLIRFAAARGVPTADRYAALQRAVAWTRTTGADPLLEPTWISLLRSLGEVGEAPAALGLLSLRRSAPRDSASALERAEMEASLFARARKHDAAAAAYGRLLARKGRSASERARFALGLARARRSLQNFAGADSAFRLAAELDSGGASGEAAAWERAREWEDDRSPQEAARVFHWALPRIRTGATVEAARIHESLAWFRAGALDSAWRALPAAGADAGPMVSYWRGRIALARKDSAEAWSAFAATWRRAPWSYEGIRAAEELRSARAVVPGMFLVPIDSLHAAMAALATSGPRSGLLPGIGGDPPIRDLEALGLGPLAREWLVACAREEAIHGVGACFAALEDRGLFRRVPLASDTLALRAEYPPAYALEVVTASKAESLDAAGVWAIMRQESGYARGVRSRAGALGLLQLLPKTADALAGHPVPEESLLVASLNVKLGARYIRSLTREMGDPRAVLAAYNAGEDVVRGWLAEKGPVDDHWVELIPYRETRDYVKQVYAAWRRYEALYGTSAP